MQPQHLIEQGEEIQKEKPKRPIREIPELFAYWAEVRTRPGNHPIAKQFTDTDVIAWVNRNMERIHRKVAAFIDRSDCTIDDFIQEAYLQAMAARNIAARKQIPLEGCFWVCFHKVCCGKVKEREKRQEAERLASRQNVRWISRFLTEKALSVMTPAQQRVWQNLLETRLTVEQIAASQGVARQTVQRVRDQGLKRAAKYFRKNPELLAA